MIYQLYTIYDKVAEQYGVPFASLNDAVAVRHFNKTVSMNMMAEPTDFELYGLGCFDTNSGQFSDLSFNLRFIVKGKVISVE